MRHLGFRHQALIYDGPDEYLAGTVPFLRDAVAAEEPALVAVGPAQAELLEDALGADAASVSFVDMHALGHNPASIIPFWQDFIDEHGGRRVCGIGEPVWSARSPAALEECRRHECLLNVAFGGAGESGLSLLCPYDAATLPGEALAVAARSHPVLARRGETSRSRAYDPHPDCFSGQLSAPAPEAEQLRFGLAGLAEVRRRSAAAAAAAGLDPVAVADFVTATSELAANSVLHGGGRGVLRLWCEEGGVHAEVEDRGRIEDPLAGRRRPRPSQQSGRGLWLANVLCDLVQIRSGDAGTVVRLHLAASEHRAA